jgi:hypothetical protein
MDNSNMKNHEIEALYFTRDEVARYLDVVPPRVYKLRDSGFIDELKGGIYSRASVEAYKLKRGDKKGGRYPKQQA